MNLSNYNAMLDFIELHDPENRQLDRLKSKGLTLTNAIIIKKIYEPLVVQHQDKSDALNPQNQKKPPEKQNEIEVDDVINRGFGRDLTKLFTQRARLSNTFHISAGAKEDAEIADSIMAVQDEINDVMEQRRYYLEHKELMPLPEVKEEFEIPDDPFELMNKLNNVRSSLSHRKRDLKKINQAKEPARYAKTEKTIEKLSKHKLYLEHEKRNQVS